MITIQSKKQLRVANGLDIFVALIMVTVVCIGFYSTSLVAAPPNVGSSLTAESRSGSEVPLLDIPRFNATLKELKGKVIVINMWATWCIPCRKEFPYLVHFYDQHRNDGLELLAISNDDLQNRGDVEKFLEQQHAKFPAFILDPKDAGRIRDALYPKWTGALPTTFIYDRQGRLSARILGAVDPKQFEATVQPLLAGNKEAGTQ